MPAIRNTRMSNGSVDSMMIAPKNEKENLSHSTVHWIGSANNRVVLRDKSVPAQSRLIGYVATLPGGRVQSVDLAGVVCSHKSAFHAVRALESRVPETMKTVSTHRVASKPYAHARREWNKAERARKAAQKKSA